MKGFRDPDRARRRALRGLRLPRVRSLLEREGEGGAGARERRREALEALAREGAGSVGPRRVRRLPVPVAAAAGLLLVIGAASLAVVLFRMAREGRPNAIERAVLAVARGGRPDPADLAVLEQEIPDETIREAVLRDPGAARSWDRLEEGIPSPPRAARGGTERLLSPRASIVSRRPVFRFEVPPPGGKRWGYVLTLERGGSEGEGEGRGRGAPARVLHTVQEPGDGGPLAVPLTGEPLREGGTYRWSVSLDPKRHPDYVALYAPEPAEFRVLPRAALEACRRVGGSGRPFLDRLLEAAALNARGFALEALATLAEGVEPSGEGPPIRPEERLLLHFRRAEAFSILGDAASLHRERRAAQPPR